MNFPPPTERQARIFWTALTGLAVAILIALIFVAIWGLGRVLHALAPVLWPIAVAGILAYLLDPVVDAIERHEVPRARAILCVFALALMAVFTIALNVVPQLVLETRELAERIPTYTARLQQRAEIWVNNPPSILRRFFEASRPGTNAPPVSATNGPSVSVTNAPSASATNALPDPNAA